MSKGSELNEWDFDIPRDNRFHNPFANSRKRRKAPKYDFKFQYSSDERTQFPEAWEEVLDNLRTHTKSRIIGFNLTVYLGPEPERPTP